MLKKENVLALCDGDLLQSLVSLSNKENQTTVEILLHLAEVERRNLHLKAGYSSLFNYCTAGELGRRVKINLSSGISSSPHL